MAQLQRIPPHDDMAEKSVLGAALINKDIFFRISEFVCADDFYAPAHKEIYAAMAHLNAESQPIDAITVVQELKQRKSLELCGGRVYITELSGVPPTTANAVQYAKIVAEKAVLRRLIGSASDIVEKSFAENLSSTKVLDFAEQSIFDISRTRKGSEVSRIDKVMDKNLEIIEGAMKNKGRLPGLPTGFADLDKKTAGLQDSDLIILAARPSMGKTAFALNIAQNAAVKQGKRVVIFSLEMSEEALGQRLLSMESRVDSNKIRTGFLNDEEWGAVQEAAARLAKSDIIIDATTGITISGMKSKCRRLCQEKRIDLIIIDYIQLMTSEERSDNRQNEVSQISRQLKQLARDIACPVVVLSQLSRASEKRQGGMRPMLSDLRESGAIEQDADVVMFLHREDYYNKDKPNFVPNNICEVLLSKQRMGETGKVELLWQPRFTKFVTLVKEDAQAAPPMPAEDSQDILF